MSIGTITGSGSTASLIDAIKALRAGAVAASQPVSNQPDPRNYAEVEEQQSSTRQQAAQAQADQRRQAYNAERRERDQEPDTGSSPRPSSAFLTQALAQDEGRDSAGGDRVAAAAAGSAAYGNAAYAEAADRASALSGRSRGVEFEVLSPNPSASSGRGVDLSV